MMIATPVFDDSGFEYFFEAVSPGGHDSGWQDEPNYTDVGLDPNSEYGYRVKARDKSPNKNETGWSSIAYAITPLPADTTAPTPNPMTWDPTVDANGFDGTPHQIAVDYDGDGEIGPFEFAATMTASIATDDSGGVVEYFFWCTTASGFSSGWQTDPSYTVRTGQKGQVHRFRVMARDPSGNTTAWSPEDVAN